MTTSEDKDEKMKKFKEKVDKIAFMRDIGMLTDEELEKLRKELIREATEE